VICTNSSAEKENVASVSLRQSNLHIHLMTKKVVRLKLNANITSN